jgi:hypothetical protein
MGLPSLWDSLLMANVKKACPKCGLPNRLPHLVPYDCELAWLMYNDTSGS